jgi:hypothetical protein
MGDGRLPIGESLKHVRGRWTAPSLNSRRAGLPQIRARIAASAHFACCARLAQHAARCKHLRSEKVPV